LNLIEQKPPEYKEVESINRIILTTTVDKTISINSLATFLHDLTHIHDRLLMIFSDNYEYIQDFPCFDRNSRITEEDQLKVNLIATKGPFSIELIIPTATAAATMPSSYAFLKIIEKAVELKKRIEKDNNVMAIAEISEDEMKEIKDWRGESLPEFVKSEIEKRYPEQIAEITGAFQRDIRLLNNNRKISISEVKVVPGNFF